MVQPNPRRHWTLQDHVLSRKKQHSESQVVQMLVIALEARGVVQVACRSSPMAVSVVAWRGKGPRLLLTVW